MEFSKVINTVDTHTSGEPTRIVLSGIPPVKGKSMAEIKEFFQRNLDFYRKALVWEPRGHKDMFGAVLVPPVSEEADFGIIFMDHGGYLDMCGHGILGIATAVCQLGMINKIEDLEGTPVLFDTPSGPVKALVKRDEKGLYASFINVPSFLYEADVKIDIPGIGEVKLDIAFGGNFFALVPAGLLNKSINRDNIPDFIKYGMLIKEKVNQKIKIQHPNLQYLKTVELVEFYEEINETLPFESKNIVVFGDGQFDRSPCGTGTSAAMAMLFYKGKLGTGSSFVNFGILGTSFKGKIVEETRVGNYRGIIPEITGRAFITGMNTFIIDPHDPFKYGYSV